MPQKIATQQQVALTGGERTQKKLKQVKKQPKRQLTQRVKLNNKSEQKYINLPGQGKKALIAGAKTKTEGHRDTKKTVNKGPKTIQSMKTTAPKQRKISQVYVLRRNHNVAF